MAVPTVIFNSLQKRLNANIISMEHLTKRILCTNDHVIIMHKNILLILFDFIFYLFI